MVFDFRGYKNYKFVKEELSMKSFYFTPTFIYHYDDTFDDLHHNVCFAWLYWRVDIYW